MRTAEKLAATLALASVLAAGGTYAAVASDPRPTQSAPTVAYSADPCGLVAEGTRAVAAAGCYATANPDVITIHTDLPRHTPMYAWVVAHETGHFLANLNNEPASECAADAYAYAVTGDAIRFTTSAYAKECGNDES